MLNRRLLAGRMTDAVVRRYRRNSKMKKIHGRMFIIGLAALSLAACSTAGERIGGAGVGAVTGGAILGPVGAVAGGVGGAIYGPRVSGAMGIPHRGHAYHRRHYRHYN
jgi:hypothetical protein